MRVPKRPIDDAGSRAVCEQETEVAAAFRQRHKHSVRLRGNADVVDAFDRPRIFHALHTTINAAPRDRQHHHS